MILVVTGSRRFNEDPVGHRRAVVTAVQSRLIAGDELWQGGAVGPDTWAAEAARQIGIRVVTYWINGRVDDSHGPSTRWWVGHPVGRRAPLERNRAMITAAARYAHAHRTTATFLAFTHDAAPTHGTEYTVRCAREGEMRGVVLHWDGRIWTDRTAQSEAAAACAP